MTNIAERNRAIKRTLAAKYGRDAVKVRGSRGTGYGWVHVHIDRTPLDRDECQQWEAEAKALLRNAQIDLGRVYTDDDCRYTMDQCHIGFNCCRYFRTMRTSDGELWAQVDYHSDEWVKVEP